MYNHRSLDRNILLIGLSFIQLKSGKPVIQIMALHFTAYRLHGKRYRGFCPSRGPIFRTLPHHNFGKIIKIWSRKKIDRAFEINNLEYTLETFRK